MPQTLELPQPLRDDINEEAAREGVSTNDHVTLLLYIAAAFHDRGKNATPFQKAVKEFMNSYALDAEQVASMTNELLQVCLTAPTGLGKTQAGLSRASAVSLRAWRSAAVHQVLPEETLPKTPNDWPDDFFEETYGSLAYDPLERLPQGEYKKREPLK